MNSTVVQNITVAQNITAYALAPENVTKHHPILVGINTVVLVSGTVSLSLMMHILKSSSTSITSIAVLNLIFTHFIFLVTVPFRIYYYATSNWNLSSGWCKVVSSMIHIHMYMSFFFYVIILITRLLAFYRKAEQLASFRCIHALLFSAGVWLTVLFVVPVTICLSYGDKNITEGNDSKCFHFGKHIGIVPGAMQVNYIVSTLIIAVAAVLTALQANALRVLCRKHRQGCSHQQAFGAQLKSLCFALIMVACFIPYHTFRLFYVYLTVQDGYDLSYLEGVNEVFLSLTTFNCLDMLTFLGKRPCYRCTS